MESANISCDNDCITYVVAKFFGDGFSFLCNIDFEIILTSPNHIFSFASKFFSSIS